VGLAASFREPRGLAFDPTGAYLLVADSANHVIRRIDLPTRAVRTLAGVAGVAGLADSGAGFGSVARFSTPLGLALNPATGLFFVADGANARLREVDGATGAVSTVAGSGAAHFDGAAAAAGFTTPRGLAMAGGALIVADSGAHPLRTFSCPGGGAAAAAPPAAPPPRATPYEGCSLTTIAGVGVPVPQFSASSLGTDGPPGVSQFNSAPTALGVDSSGVAFVLDPARTIRRVPPTAASPPCLRAKTRAGL